MAPTLLPLIDAARCTGCWRCVAACRPHALSLEARGWVTSSTLHDPGACTGCGACEAACPYAAITTPAWQEMQGRVGDVREQIARLRSQQALPAANAEPRPRMFNGPQE